MPNRFQVVPCTNDDYGYVAPLSVNSDGLGKQLLIPVYVGWDPSFNAITGLNGSGKSNILDAICFVLGITNMTAVRKSRSEITTRIADLSIILSGPR